ncbi:cupin domain-containing protein [Glutamicibacter protophormiae]|jgi:quercetin dioxygenase-like cupin family protein|uniref:Quercetin dioxygenase-like cupin family protein n=1 Tax=Glutamicibacter protophormiae TaxID=37930 RepID=A0ABS4XNC2_GLUPR|nr:cupin domain-containing protein [Glutamicibacter protophormiae]MBP2397875.1 quercetin dioxygenase-like cupin family protein [Glutamicibacter protophormiae]QRQ78591.1 cupin domain-containing protein [Glutamicibacter protophormiae]WPR64659.1 cupin domain-containing protein [Glutamicibacter protophormiae]WPR68154.1 cupin domain-containing protein [Glutamicibacter protophormiae]GGL85935.1 LuxR family transcriptional regulator [Glutamicibacter protophormiae]
MKKFSLAAIARSELREAVNASNGRAARTVFGGHEHVMRQTVMALAQGTELQEHENPGEATILVISGRIRVSSGGEQWEGRSQDLLILPSGRIQVTALEESSILLSVAKSGR